MENILIQTENLEEIIIWLKNNLIKKRDHYLSLVQCNNEDMLGFIEDAITNTLFSSKLHLGHGYIPTAYNFFIENYTFLYKIEEEKDEKIYKVLKGNVGLTKKEEDNGWCDWEMTEEFSNVIEELCDNIMC